MRAGALAEWRARLAVRVSNRLMTSTCREAARDHYRGLQLIGARAWVTSVTMRLFPRDMFHWPLVRFLLSD